MPRPPHPRSARARRDADAHNENIEPALPLRVATELIGHQLDQLAAGDCDPRDVAPVMLWGAPGIGKSAAIRAVAEERGVGFIDIRLAQRDPVDMRGLPVPDGDTVRWLPAAEWPRDPDSHGILLFDELTAADRTLQVAAYELILDRRLGELYRLPDGWLVCAAGNRSQDRAVTTPMSSALANRLLHLDVGADLDDWLAWAASAGIDPLVRRFLQFRPELLMNMNAADLERGWPSPRTWARVSALLGNRAAISEPALWAGIRGLVGQGAAIELKAWLAASEEAPSIDGLLGGFMDVQIPTRPDLLFAFAKGVSARLFSVADRKRAIDVFFDVGLRMPSDFATMMLTEALDRAGEQEWKEVLDHPEFARWVQVHGDPLAEPNDDNRRRPAATRKVHRDGPDPKDSAKAVGGQAPEKPSGAVRRIQQAEEDNEAAARALLEIDDLLERVANSTKNNTSTPQQGQEVA